MREGLFILLLGSACHVWSQDTTSIELVFAGDIMQHESQMNSAFDPVTQTYDYSGVFDQVKSLIQPADIAVGNLEFTFGGKPYKGYPAFSAPDELIGAICNAGFDVMMTANNHSVDRGRKGIQRTIRLLDSAGMVHTGTFADTLDYLNDYPLVLIANGIRLALLNYTYGTNGIAVPAENVVNLIDTNRIAIDLERARLQNPDAIIVFFHWGVEYESMPNGNQLDLAQFCLSRGAKLIIGAHPHVLQPMIWDKERDQAVIYSLGNLVSGQRVRYRNGGALAHIELKKSTDSTGASRTTLADVSYSLVWVYRAPDSRKSFKLIPIRHPVDTLAVEGANSRKLMKQFVEDSRTFLDRENRHVLERARKKSN